MQAGRQTHRKADRQTGRQAGRQTHRKADRQTDWQAGRQTGRQADRQTDRYRHVLINFIHRPTMQTSPEMHRFVVRVRCYGAIDTFTVKHVIVIVTGMLPIHTSSPRSNYSRPLPDLKKHRLLPSLHLLHPAFFQTEGEREKEERWRERDVGRKKGGGGGERERERERERQRDRETEIETERQRE